MSRFMMPVFLLFLSNTSLQVITLISCVSYLSSRHLLMFSLYLLLHFMPRKSIITLWQTNELWNPFAYILTSCYWGLWHPWLLVEYESLISASIVGASTFISLSSANMLLCRRMCGTRILIARSSTTLLLVKALYVHFLLEYLRQRNLLF